MENEYLHNLFEEYKVPSIERIYIEGFKKFEKLEVSFNDNINILVGENESGKSTVLEAISLVFK